jgi:hypothetical protein
LLYGKYFVNEIQHQSKRRSDDLPLSNCHIAVDDFLHHFGIRDQTLSSRYEPFD